jgi:acetylornithine/succinyldiaminopimelate/putrescine aminotransferase
LCDERGIVLIYDEVQTGVGRTGQWFFAGSAAVGVSGHRDAGEGARQRCSGRRMSRHEAIASHIKENDLGTTFGGGMLAMAAVTATLEAIEKDRMLENVRVSRRICGAIARGRAGCRSSWTRVSVGASSSAITPRQVHKRLLERKVITGTSSNPKVLRLLPPLCLTEGTLTSLS